MVDIVVASQLQGWITYEELLWLAEQAQRYSTIVEIGSYLGRSTRALGDNTPGVVYAVDDFKGPRDMSLIPEIQNNIQAIFNYNVGELINEGKVVPMVADHASIRFAVSPDMVFIDGDHTYEAVKRDIQRWWPQVASGGLLCGHDYTNIADVADAVDELLTEPKVAPRTSIWFLQKK